MINKAKLKKFRFTFVTSTIILMVAFVISVATGQASLSPFELWQTFIGQGTAKQQLILFEFRLPRIFVTILAGMGLAISGAILQSITRNPLAEPGILGISAGAGFSVAIYVLFFTVEVTSFIYVLPLFALMGGMATAVIIYVMSYVKGEGAEPTRLILVGVGMQAVMTGGILTLANRFDQEQYSFLASWLAGKIWGDDWTFVLALIPWLLFLLPYVFMKSNVLNTLSMNEHVSIGLGVNVERERLILLIVAVALASASVSVSGGIVFVGLMAPHIARSLVGPRHQWYLPIAAILGSILLLTADTIGRVILDPSGIPAGVIVTLIGAPYFMYLLARK